MWTPKLEEEFEAVLWVMLRRSKSETSYVGTYFARMLKEHGGRRTAEILLAKPQPSEGFIRLSIEENKPELTMEYVVASNPWNKLFSKSEVRKARSLLGEKAPEC